MQLGTHSQEHEFVGLVQLFDHSAGLVGEVGNKSAVLERFLRVHGTSDRHSLCVDYEDALDALVRLDAVEGFFHFALPSSYHLDCIRPSLAGFSKGVCACFKKASRHVSTL